MVTSVAADTQTTVITTEHELVNETVAGFTRIYSRQIDSNNDGVFVKRKLNGSVVEIQVVNV